MPTPVSQTPSAMYKVANSIGNPLPLTGNRHSRTRDHLLIPLFLAHCSAGRCRKVLDFTDTPVIVVDPADAKVDRLKELHTVEEVAQANLAWNTLIDAFVG